MTDAIDLRELRNAFGCFATGIAVVTALDGGTAVGVTINSFSSLSLDPPLVMWALGRQSDIFASFCNAGVFVVNILSTRGAHLSSRFATKGDHLVDMTGAAPTELGPPAFQDSLAYFECETCNRYEGGDHIILVGQVKRFTYVRDPEHIGEQPLLYYRGRYGTLVDFTG